MDDGKVLIVFIIMAFLAMMAMPICDYLEQKSFAENGYEQVREDGHTLWKKKADK
jgi:hypothetical protein